MPTSSRFEEPRAIWDRRYAYVREQGGRSSPYEPWLMRWRSRLPAGSRILDLGCGAGYDTHWLSETGYSVVGGDFSPAALALAQRSVPAARLLQLDLRQGLPFAPACFAGVVANLSLHYFSRSQTHSIMRQVRKCLQPGGVLLARFNSTRDPSFTAESHPSGEPGTCWKDGVFKHYFDRPELEELFAGPWRVLVLEERSIRHYERTKVLWEVAAIQS